MYKDYFGFNGLPFSIAPDPNYLYLSEQHKEALAHLMYGVGEQGGFVLLSGEVGTGKTTVCRALLHQMPEQCEVAYVVNPRQSETELLRSICDEFGIYYYYEGQGSNYLVELINEHLLALHAKGRNAVLIVDEAQNLGVPVLEQLRLLTNLETDKKKLLQLILLGQPELNALLAKTELRQMAQRITARHHLNALTEVEVAAYIEHRLLVAGFRGRLFDSEAIKFIYRKSQGVPRLINVICDRCLLGVYSANGNQVSIEVAKKAVNEVMGPAAVSRQGLPNSALSSFREKLSSTISRAASVRAPTVFASAAVLIVGLTFFGFHRQDQQVSSDDNSTRLTERVESVEQRVAPKSAASHELDQSDRQDKGPQLAKSPQLVKSAQQAKTQALSEERSIAQRLLVRLAERFEFESSTVYENCDTLKRAGLSCAVQRSTLQSVSLLDTTVLVKLPNRVLPTEQRNPQLESQWVLVTALQGDEIDVEFADGQRLSLPSTTVSEAWPGKYYWLWRPPELYRQYLSLGETDEYVAWLSKALDQFERQAQLTELNELNNASSVSSLQRASYIIEASEATVNNVVSTALLRRLARVKRLLDIDAPGVPQELAHLLASSDSWSDSLAEFSGLAMRPGPVIASTSEK